MTESIVDRAAAGVLEDLPPSTTRDQNAAILRDRLRDYGLDPTDPAAVRGALAGIFIIREQLIAECGDRALLLLPGADLLRVPQVVAAIEGLAVMVDQHRKAGR